MATEHIFRRIALALEGAIESAHMGHPDFRANGRIFATIQVDPAWAMVKLTPEQQHHFLHHESSAFKPAAGAWGAGGSTLVHLASVNEETLGEALTLAWRNARDHKGGMGRKGGMGGNGRMGRKGGMGRKGRTGRTVTKKGKTR